MLSIAVHLVVALQLTTGEKSESRSYIELEFEAQEAPEARNIPEPVRRKRSVMPEEMTDLKGAAPLPVDPVTVSPVLEPPDVAQSQLLAWVPELEADDQTAVEESAPAAAVLGDKTTVDVAAEYYRQILKRIEAEKKYPYAARKMKAEGRALVGFVIENDGTAEAVEIVESSGNRLLDKAAVAAVVAASPFPNPPDEVASAPLPLEVGVVFQLNRR